MTPSLTLIIVVFTVLVSLAAFSNGGVFARLVFEPFVIQVRREWYRFITHAFIHANLPHLAVNMFVLFMFGSGVERLYEVTLDRSSTLPYLLLYLGGIVFSALPSYRRNRYNPSYRAVGASGAVSAVLFAHILMLPTLPVYLFFIPVPIPGWIFGGLYLAYSWYMDKRGGDNVAHDAHFFGAIYGLLFTATLDPGTITRLFAIF